MSVYRTVKMGYFLNFKPQKISVKNSFRVCENSDCKNKKKTNVVTLSKEELNNKFCPQCGKEFTFIDSVSEVCLRKGHEFISFIYKKLPNDIGDRLYNLTFCPAYASDGFIAFNFEASKEKDFIDNYLSEQITSDFKVPEIFAKEKIEWIIFTINSLFDETVVSLKFGVYSYEH